MSAPEESLRLLLIDDDERLRERMGFALSTRGFSVRTAGSREQALSVAAQWPPTHAVIDLRLGADSGQDLLAALMERNPELRAVILTGFGSIPAAVQAVRQGAVDFLTKPADPDLLAAALRGQSAPSETTPPSLAAAEWEHIQQILSTCDGNITLAARRLGIHRRTLQRKLQRGPLIEGPN
jgi:two-component system response regulator RegA